MGDTDLRSHTASETSLRILELSYTKMNLEWAKKEPKIHRLLTHVSLYESLCLERNRQQTVTWYQYGDLGRRLTQFAHEWYSNHYRGTSAGKEAASAWGQDHESSDERDNSDRETIAHQSEDNGNRNETWEVRDYSTQQEKRQTWDCIALHETLSNGPTISNLASVKSDTEHNMPRILDLLAPVEQTVFRDATHEQNIWINF